MAAESKAPTQEREARVMSGWMMLPVTIALYIAGPVLIAFAFINGSTGTDGERTARLGDARRRHRRSRRSPSSSAPGFFTLQPNEARVLDPLRRLQGHRASRVGFCWGNPFYSNGPAGAAAGQSIWSQNKARRATARPARRAEEAASATRSPARPHAQRRQAQGQRQARQPRGHRRRRGLARRGHRQGGLRRRRLRDVRGHPERDRRAPPRQRLPVRLRRDRRRHRGRDHAARQRRRGLRGAARGARRAARRRPA